MSNSQRLSFISICATLAGFVGCGSSDPATESLRSSGGSTSTAAGGVATGGQGMGGALAKGGTGSGGLTSTGGSVVGSTALAGGTSAGGVSIGGTVATSGTVNAGGSTITGGAVSAGGIATGGTLGSAGASTGGAASSGGAALGGKATGGATTGGAATGGAPASGGAMATGGAAGCPVELVGWATVNDNNVNGTTGGGNVTPTTVTTLAAFKAAVQDSAARVVVVSGTIKTTDGDGYGLSVASNKTIMGANKSATIYGGLVLSGVSNVIIRNLNIQGVYPNPGPGDTLASSNAHHVWYDHLALWDADDGLMDITNQSNYHTVSWTKFYYTNSANGHRLASLNGSGGGDHPEDSRYLKSTYHHNWWSTLVHERMPRMMYGKLHAFNNYFNAPGNLYCIGVGSFGSALVENNYFKDVQSPHIFMYNWHMYIAATGNVYDNTTGNKDTGLGGTRDTNDPALNVGVEEAAAFTPPYKYTLDAPANVPAIVQKCAGPQ